MIPRTTGTNFALACFAMLLTLPAYAQDAVTIDPSLAQKHLLHKVEAQYPADAQAAQVQGVVGLQLSIDTTGHVTNAEATSGPDMLRQAAIDATRQWVYKPFVVGGSALAATAQVSVTFTLPSSAGATPQNYTPPPPPPSTSAAAPAPPAPSGSGFESAAGPAVAPPSSGGSSAGFESAAGPAVAPAGAPPPAKSGFESAMPAPDAQPAPVEPSAAAPPPPASTPARASSGFESATPSADTPAPAPASATPAFAPAAPVESAPSTIPPPAEAAAPLASSADAGGFGPLSQQCHTLMAAKGDVDTLISVCGQMAAAADNFPSDSKYIERRAAYVFDAAALLRAWRYPEAEAMAKRAVAVVEEGHDDVSGASAAYAVLGNAQALNGKLAEADKSLETAETLERKAVEAAAGQPSQSAYSQTLRTILLFHAETLERMGNKDAAANKRAEAATLLPS